MPPPGPAPLLTPALLSAIRTHPSLPHHTWYFIAGVALSALNRPDEIATVFRHALDKGAGSSASGELASVAAGEKDGKRATGAMAEEKADGKLGEEEQLRIARRMREALIKSAPIAGLPRAINALLALKTATPAHLLDAPLAYSPTGRSTELYDVPPSRILHRGQTFWDAVYGKVSRRVMGQLERSGTEDLGIVARLAYGYVLSNASVLNARDSSFVLMAGLIPQDVNPQLKGHLKGALNGGATAEEVRAVRDVVLRICEASGMRHLPPDEPGGWGWRDEVANI